MTNRQRAEVWLNRVSSDESWIDASSEHVKASLTQLLDEVRTEAKKGVVYDHGCLDIESGLLDD